MGGKRSATGHRLAEQEQGRWQFAKETRSGVVIVWIRDMGGKCKHLEDIVKRIRGGESTKNEKT